MNSKKAIKVGEVLIGGGAPVSIQTMTNTSTEDIEGTLAQIERAAEVGCDIIRVSCPTPESTKAIRELIANSKIPIIADIHFNYKRAIEAIEAGAHCVRINPGNISKDGIKEIVFCAKSNDKSIRIGINSGSLSQDILEKYGEPSSDAIVESAVFNAQYLEELGFEKFKISVKSSNVKNTIEAYRKLSKIVDYPLHIGVTEAGPVYSGIIKSAIGIGSLLADGIGDTIRVSLSTRDIVEEVKAAKQILKSLGLYSKGVDIISCPTCARTLIDVVGIAQKIEEITQNMEVKMTISILGCVVNGPGEALKSDIGIFGFQQGIAKVYAQGKEVAKCKEDEVLSYVTKIIKNKELL